MHRFGYGCRKNVEERRCNVVGVLNHMAIARNLRVARARTGLSQKELAKRSGVCETTISFLESGKHEMIRMSTLQKLADVLGVPIEELIEE